MSNPLPNETVKSNGIELVDANDNCDREALHDTQPIPEAAREGSPADINQVSISAQLDKATSVGESIRFTNCMHSVRREQRVV